MFDRRTGTVLPDLRDGETVLVGGGWSGLGGNWVVIRYLSMEGTLRSTHRGWEDGSYGLAAPVFGVPHRERDELLHTAPPTTIITVGIVGIVGVVVRVRAVGSQPLDVCDEQNTRRRQSNCP